MKTAIVVSKNDIAGINIKQELESRFVKVGEHFCMINNRDVSLHIVETDSIYCESLDKKIDAELFIFATRHKSDSGKPCLCVHVPGNWDKAIFGGVDRKLCIAPAKFMKRLFLELSKCNDEYTITLEATHHGPLIEKPCVFIEIGSCEKDWKDQRAAAIIGSAIANSLDNGSVNCTVALGVGGTHYCETFNKIELRTSIAFSHICPKHMIPFLSEELICYALTRTYEQVTAIVLDWKGLGKEKHRIIDMTNRMGIRILRSDQLSQFPLDHNL